MDSKQVAELLRLASEACDGPLAPADQRSLDEFLRSEPTAATLWRSFARLHVELALQTRADVTLARSLNRVRDFIAEFPDEPFPERHIGEPPITAPDGEFSVLKSAGTDSLTKKSGRSWRWPTLTLSAAASIFALFGVAYLYRGDSGADVGALPRSPVVQNRDESKDSLTVARIVRKVDCDLEGDRWRVDASAEVTAGQTLSMHRGLLELEFTSGARVTLEAPVSFTAHTPMRGVLNRGRLTAHVPKPARGFTVTTPGGDAVDLGTEFGLYVREGGATEAHVFSGEVVVQPRNIKNADEPVRLTDDMAVRLNHLTDDMQLVAASDRNFVKMEFKDDSVSTAPPVERGLKLWLSADRRIQADDDNLVAGWGDSLGRSRDLAHNAWQMGATQRPEVVQRTLGGRDAIRFKGGQFMVTDPLALGSSISIAVVCRIDNTAPSTDYGRQIMNLNGPPHLVLAVDNERRLDSRMYLGWMNVGAQTSGHVNVGHIVTPEPLGPDTVVILSVYDSEANQSRLYVNGVLVGAAEAPPIASTLSPRYIGAHMYEKDREFVGDIGEVLIYDAPLTVAEAKKLSAALMNWYGIGSTAADSTTSAQRRLASAFEGPISDGT